MSCTVADCSTCSAVNAFNDSFLTSFRCYLFTRVGIVIIIIISFVIFIVDSNRLRSVNIFFIILLRRRYVVLIKNKLLKLIKLLLRYFSHSFNIYRFEYAKCLRRLYLKIRIEDFCEIENR